MLSSFLELLLLSLGNLHDLTTNKHLLLHLGELLNQLLLLSLRLLLGLLLLLELLKELLLFLLFQMRLILDIGSVLLSLQANLFLLLVEPLLKLTHLLLVDDHFGGGGGTRHDAHVLHDLVRCASLIERVQLLSKLGNFLLVLSQEGVFRIFVDPWLVLDVFGSRSIPKSVHGLIKVVVCGTDVCNHDRLGVSTERVLQQPSQFRVTIRDVSCLRVCQRRDNMAQRGERQVDLSGLLESVTRGTCLSDPLRARQVHHIELTNTNMLLVVGAQLTTFNRDREEGVRARRMCIHISGAHRPILRTDIHDLTHLISRFGRKIRQVLDIDARVNFFMELESILRVFGEQIAHFLIVDLHVGCAHQELSLIRVSLDALEDVIEGARHDTSQLLVPDHTRHRMRLARTRLSVSKDCTIVTR